MVVADIVYGLWGWLNGSRNSVTVASVAAARLAAGHEQASCAPDITNPFAGPFHLAANLLAVHVTNSLLAGGHTLP